MGNKTVKKAKQVVTINSVVVTFGGHKTLSLRWAHKGASGVSGKALFLDLVLFIRVFMMTCKVIH